MNAPEELRYAETHEWLRIEDGKGYVGITDFAQSQLGDLVYVELPEPEMEVEAGDILCSVESVKAASDIMAPVSGKVVEANEALEDDAGLINSDPYGSWICVLEVRDPAEADSLMDAASYRKQCEEEATE